MGPVQTPRWPGEGSPITGTVLDGTPSPAVLSEMQDAVGRRYRIRGQDTGGYGAVWFVYDATAIRNLTLKTYRPDRFSKEEGRRAIEDEARRWIGVPPHLNVVTAESFEILDGYPFIVLEHVAGGSLAARLTQGALDDAGLVNLVVDVCAGMLYLNASGIACHRDLSPANILLTSGGRAKLSDFGGAVRTSDRAGREIVPAALPYMAPEQFHHQEDIRSDIYSFGMVLFHALTGRPAFALPQSDDARGLPLALYRQHRAEPLPALPATRSVVAEAIGHCIYICTAKSPHERYNDFGALLSSLEHALGRLPRRGLADAADPWRLATLPASMRKSAALFQLGQEREALAFAAECLNVPPDVTAEEAAEAFLSRSRALEDQGQAALAARDYDIAAAYFEAGLDALATKIVGLDAGHEDAVRAQTRLLMQLRATALDAMGEADFAAAVRGHADAAGRMNRQAGSFPQVHQAEEESAASLVGSDAGIVRPAERIANEGRHRAIDGDHEAAVQQYRDALALDPEHRVARLELGISLNELGRYQEAIAEFDEVLRRWPSDPTALTDKGFSLEKLGRYQEAISFCQRALHVKPEEPMPLVNLGQCHLFLEAYAEARDCFRQLLAALPGEIRGLHGTLRASAGMGDYEGALEACEALMAANEPLDGVPAVSLLEHLTASRRYVPTMRIVLYLLTGGATERFVFETNELITPGRFIYPERIANIAGIVELFAHAKFDGADGRLLDGFRHLARRGAPGAIPDHYDGIVRDLIRTAGDEAALKNLEARARQTLASRPEHLPSDEADVAAQIAIMSASEKESRDALARQFSAAWTQALTMACGQHGYKPDFTADLADEMLALGQRGDYRRSLQRACKALARNPYDLRCLTGAAICLKRMEFPDLAVLMYEHTLLFTPLSYEAHHNLGLAFMTLERWNDAVYHFKEALLLNPGGPANLKEALQRRSEPGGPVSAGPVPIDAQLAEATAEIEAGRYWKATAILKEASTRSGGEPGLWKLGRLYYGLGMYAEAAGTLEKYVNTRFATRQTDAERTQAFVALGMAQGNVAIASGDPELYRKAVVSLECSLGEPPDPETLHLIGGLHRRFGDHARAAALLEQAARALPDNDMVHTELAISLSETGGHAQALAAAEIAVRLNPAEHLHRQTLAQVRRRLLATAQAFSPQLPHVSYLTFHQQMTGVTDLHRADSTHIDTPRTAS